MPDPHHLKANDNEPKRYERPSERMFRRSRAAKARRREAVQKESKFMRLVFGIAGMATFLAFLFFYVFAMSASAAETTAQESAMTQPIFGNFTFLDLVGVAFVVVAGYAVWRKYK